MNKVKTKTKVDPHSIITLDGVMELIQNPRKLLWVNFKAGFVRGFAGVIGAALAIVFISFIALSRSTDFSIGKDIVPNNIIPVIPISIILLDINFFFFLSKLWIN